MITVYSSARKVVEGTTYGHFDSRETEWCEEKERLKVTKRGRQIDMENKSESDVKFLIALLNKEGLFYISVRGWMYKSGVESFEIRKIEVDDD